MVKSLPVTFVLKEVLNGGGRVRCFCVGVCEGYALIDSRKLEGHDYFSQKFLNSPVHPSPLIKNVPSLKHVNCACKLHYW